MAGGHLKLTTEVKFLKGVGPRLGELLASRGVVTVEDLLYILPFRYEDRSRMRPISELLEGETATVVAQVQTLRFHPTRRGVMMLELTAGDGRGTLHCNWYNADYLRDKLQSGQTVAFYGRIYTDRGWKEMRQPEFEILEVLPPRAFGGSAPGLPRFAETLTLAPPGPLGEGLGLEESLKLGRIVPVYEAIGVLSAGRLRRLVHRALEELPAAFPDPLPDELRRRLVLPGRREALAGVHFPAPATPLEQLQMARTPAHRRLIFEELFYLQAGLEMKRRKVRRQAGLPVTVNAAVRERLKAMLPFHPTADQKQALKEIVEDMTSGRPMRRLLQGDVGSGKTIVALEAAAVAIANGYQVAFMAPTQILAEQHYLYARQVMPEAAVELVQGGRGRTRRTNAAKPQLAVGTQALLEGKFQFENLGLVIVDEQHRFGVMQRFSLMHKGGQPAHVLVMTATPIPRTLALALYGDLDTSLIRQPPPGGLPITTKVVPEARSGEVYEFVRRQAASGRQAYFVYPLLEESEALDLKPATRMFERLRRLFPEFKVGLIHGQLKAEEKQRLMSQFRQGRIQVLVATTVIEVGLDVPNATLMVIEHAERFGISQLHQLRGRVGRPQPAAASARSRSYCFLLQGEECGEAARQRLGAIARTRDGFELAETDLKLRGPGEFFGTRQSGQPMFTVAQPLRDHEIMELARSEARVFLDTASAAEQRRLVAQIQERWQRRYGLVEA